MRIFCGSCAIHLNLFAALMVAVFAYPGVPQSASLYCEEGKKNFPFLKPWVAKLENFIAPYEVGSTEGSLFYALGATTVGKNGVEAWRQDKFTLPIEWKNWGGSLESAWLGALPTELAPVQKGPGYSTVVASSSSRDSSQMGSRRDVGVHPVEPALRSYGFDTMKNAGPLGSWARLWSLFYKQAELDLLTGCTERNCKIKFDDPELKLVTGASHQYRLNKFRQVIQDRIEGYRKDGHVWAYEGTYKPLDWEDLPISPAFPAKLETHFWLPRDRSFFGYEVFDPEPGHHKAVVGLFSRQCEKRGAGGGAYTACADIVLYNNHYFDYWARVVFFFPWCDVQVALAYETMDIDQIKESRLIRILFGSEMRDLLGTTLETRLKHLHMIGF